MHQYHGAGKLALEFPSIMYTRCDVDQLLQHTPIGVGSVRT